MSENTGFFSKILTRRIPQFFGIFLAGSWTALEFTGWAVERYSLSPNWEEVLIVTLLLFLPMILVLAWHHGAPGKQKWTLFEKIFLPLYLLVIPLTLHHLYKDEDLGKTVEMVMVEDETGKMQEREIVKSQFIKPIILFPFQNKTNDSKFDILAGITSNVLNRDLKQNIFYSSPEIGQLSESIKNDKQSIKRLPLSYQLNQAKERGRDYLLSGELLQAGANYKIKVSIYNASNGRKDLELIEENSNYFSAIDQLTIKINEHFKTGSEYTDLPIEDLFTYNWDAFNDYAQAVLIFNFGDNVQEAEPLFISAIEKDETFSIAAFNFALFSIRQNKVVKAKKYTQLAQQHQTYRLTERERFPINATAYYLNQQSQKGFGVLDQWIKLYPTDTFAYLLKAEFLRFNTDSYEESIANLKKVIELDPSQHALWDAIGDIYNSVGQYDKALDAYEKYSIKNSSNPIAYKNLGDLYKKTGNYDSVISNYQSALGLEPNNQAVLSNLADAYSRIGRFRDAEATFKKAIQNSNTSASIVNNKIRLSQFYWDYGVRESSTKYLQEAFKEFAETQSVDTSLQREALFAWQYHLAGQTELAQTTIDKAVKLGVDSGEDILFINTQIAQGMLLNYLGKPEESLIVYDELLKIGGAYSSANIAIINHFKGRSLYFNQQYEEALIALEPILERSPDRTDFLLWTAMNYLALGNLEKSESLYKRLLILAPAIPTYNLGMAKVLLAKNEVSGAKEYLETAISNWQYADMEIAELTEAQNLLSSL
ncbi:tetratricopeptide repeat protein [Kangiella sp. HZ709]|uniref:tetratricopeptide repeat protein n=1 Tax=Kangiella sp. HZ709 TaxID=2666328 RepID=UPI0012AEFCA8|nr:tetratricopeptide repeat protein [Kangiella sp. HZ709]MRX27395.1 tetratricopeptide repeat protein [Kangiella sp. HZ709]